MFERSDDASTEAFADAFVGFARTFGLLNSDQTPCGAPMSTVEAHALAVLRAAAVTQRTLGERLHLTKSTTSRLVDQLTARGWAHRAPDPHDGRAHRIELTETGRRVADNAARRRSDRLSALLEKIPKAQRPAVTRALRALEEASRDLP